MGHEFGPGREEHATRGREARWSLGLVEHLTSDCDQERALRAIASASQELLGRTAELPDTEAELLTVLAEYRYAVFAFVEVVVGL